MIKEYPVLVGNKPSVGERRVNVNPLRNSVKRKMQMYGKTFFMKKNTFCTSNTPSINLFNLNIKITSRISVI